MQVLQEALGGVMLLEPAVFEDSRGSFFESYNRQTFQDLTGFDGDFVQDNHSTSTRGVIRGIHYQQPKPQGKLVRCIDGAIWDLVVDLRRSSPMFGMWHGFELTAANRRQAWVPEGFGHGFVVTSDSAQVLYKTTSFWDADCDRSIRWNDPTLGVEWPLREAAVVSEKDQAAPLLSDAILFD